MREIFTEVERAVLRGVIVEASYAADLDARTRAEFVFDSLVHYVKRNEAHLDEIQVGDMSGFMVRGPDGGLPNRFMVVFLKAKAGYGGTYVKHPQAGHMITLYDAIVFSDDPDGLAERLTRLPRFRKTFVHEYVHYLDQKRFKGQGSFGAKSAQATKRGDLTGYYRTPAEFNAHFQAVAGEIEETIFERVNKATIPGRATLKKYTRKEMAKHFANFSSFRHYIMHEVGGLKYPIEQVERQLAGSKWERKWQKRMVVLYRGLKRRVEDALR